MCFQLLGYLDVLKTAFREFSIIPKQSDESLVDYFF